MPRLVVRRALARGAVALAAAVLIVAVMADPGRAQMRVIAHWPHSPVNHLLGRAAPAVTPTFAINLRGNFVSAANTLLTCPANLSARRRRRARSGEPCLGAKNNDLDMRYVNVDPTGHFNSSQATVTLPDGARVVHAYLYWGADLARGVGASNGASDGAPGGETPVDPANPAAGGTNTQWTSALMRVNGGAYTTVDATRPERDGVWQGIASWYSTPGNRPGFAYQVRADVTPEIEAAVLAARAHRRRHRLRATKTLTVTVADVQAGKGFNRHGGWTLLVAYELPSAAWRNLTLYDGFAYVQVQGGEQKVVGPLDFTGFKTPATGTVGAHATTWTYEGDKTITGDYMSLGGLGKSCTQLTKMHDALNPVDDFFNSTISVEGVELAGRTPSYANQLGFDRDRLAVPEGTIGNNASGASVCLGTVGDTYFFGGIAFDTLIGAPNLQIQKQASAQTAKPGDVITYTTTVSNPAREGGEATETATNLVIADPLPSGVDFAGFNGNPPCTYDASTRIVTCRIASLAPDAAVSFAYRVTVSAAAQGTSPASLINAACYAANSANQPDNEFRGCDTATVQVPPNPYVDLGVVKTVSADVVAPGAPLTWTLVATNHGPGTSTGFVLADELPPGVAFTGLTADPALTCTAPAPGGGRSLTCTAASVAAGTSLTVTVTATVPAGTADGTVLRNIATVNGDQPEPEPDPTPNRDTALTTVVTPPTPVPPTPPTPAPPDPYGPPAPPVPPDRGAVLAAVKSGTRLTLTKRANARTVTPGKRITFRLRVRNIGEARALRVRVCDHIPSGLTAVRGRGFKRRKGTRIWCRNLRGLALGASRTVRISARAARHAPLSVTNIASARAVNARRVRARLKVGHFVACPSTARAARDGPVAHAAC